MKLISETKNVRRYEDAHGVWHDVRLSLHLEAGEATALALEETPELRDAIEKATLDKLDMWALGYGYETVGTPDTRWVKTTIVWSPDDIDDAGNPVIEFEPYVLESFWAEIAFWPPAPEATS